MNFSYSEQDCLNDGIALAEDLNYAKATQDDLYNLPDPCLDCLRRWKDKWQARINYLDGNNGGDNWSEERDFSGRMLPTSHGINSKTPIMERDAREGFIDEKTQESLVGYVDNYLGSHENLALLLQNLEEERNLRWIVSNICYHRANRFPA